MSSPSRASRMANNRRNEESPAAVAEVPTSAARTATAGGVVDAVPALDDPSLYVNRELSLLEFQRRVLEEAQDPANPLLERVKFLSIYGSNMDEFFMVRVAGLKQQADAGTHETKRDGYTAEVLLERIRQVVTDLHAEAYRLWREELLPALSSQCIQLRSPEDLADQQRQTVQSYFASTVFPTLTPLAFDPGRPFPHISNLSLNLAVLIRDEHGVERFARVKVPDTLPQLVPAQPPLPPSQRAEQARPEQTFVWLEQLIGANLSALFPGLEIVESHPFYVTRDADMAIQELEADDLLESIEEGVRQRRFGDVVRLVVNRAMPEGILDILKTNLEITPEDVYRVEGPLALSRLRHLLSSADRPDLRDRQYVPAVPAHLSPKSEDDLFTVIRREDVLLHHPFDSFQPVVDFLRRAARDPDVLAIKTTLYRVGRNSPVVEALLEAMEHGKQVAVLVELKARFDEEPNIGWAKALEREGVHVVYGIVGVKVHAKAAMVVRREGDTIRRYVHLATGNYNFVTAHLYTDIGLLTCDEAIGADVTDLFNYLTGYSAKSDYRKLLVAPINLRRSLEALIRREIGHARAGRPARLIFKMNALEDADMVQLLYEASQAGVQVDLLVRGVCCLRPGLPGVSERIRVTSIVGQFLEHSRVYCFLNDGQEEVYLGSADLMSRNLNRRVEVVFPVENPKLVRRIRDEILETYLSDQAKARHMLADGTYVRTAERDEKSALNSQHWLMANAHSRKKA